MNIAITGHHFELTDKNKSFISYKIQNKLQHFDMRIHNINFVVTQEGIQIKTECKITSDFGEFFASSINNPLEASVEHTLTKILAEIIKKHEKIVAHKASVKI